VAASLGCYGAHLADGSEYTAGGYRGVGVEQLTAFHAEKLAALVATRPDAVAFETIPCVDEVKAVTALLSSSGVPDGPPGAPVAWVALACQSPELLNSGETLEDALRALEDPPSGAPLDVDHVAVGVNCTDPRHVRAILRTMRDTCRRGRVLVAYPNLGETWEQAPEGSDGNSSGGGGGGAWAPVAGTCVAEAEYVALARGWYDGGDGATIIGGCCRVNPPLIAELKRALC
jgi:homocysteine S-methyltransferase